MRTPICRIYIALAAHFKYLEETSVYRGGPFIEDKREDDPTKKVREFFDRMVGSA